VSREQQRSRYWPTQRAFDALGLSPPDHPRYRDDDDSIPCCDYTDHSPGPCACPEHPPSVLHPFGTEDAQ
jgi:hypothetical protein